MKRQRTLMCLVASSAVLLVGATNPESPPQATEETPISGHMEVPDDPYIAAPRSAQFTSPAQIWDHNGYLSIQVNVDSEGNNIVGDAANEPSIAVDPTQPERMVIGWRQFDTIASNFRQGGWGYTSNSGQTWTFPGVLEAGVFRSDPVLDFDAAGNIFYDSLGVPGGDFCTDTFTSSDGGHTWGSPIYSYGGDKQWIGVDRSGGIGDGQIYHSWNSTFSCAGHPGEFNHSTDGGQSFEAPILVPTGPVWGVTTVGPNGEVYLAGRTSTPSGFALVKSTTLRDTDNPSGFDFATDLDLGGPQRISTGPNPEGLLGQVWVAADPSIVTGPGAVYVLSSINPPGADPLDVHFVRSTDGGLTFSSPLRINDDQDSNAWQWFGTMSVAPSGRIDVIWNDTRNDPGGYDSELFYSYSGDGGLTWSDNTQLSPAFDPHLGWPQQSKIGDYYDMVSDLRGAHLAYSATFNGEQDVYYLRIHTPHIFSGGFETGNTSRWDQPGLGGD